MKFIALQNTNYRLLLYFRALTLGRDGNTLHLLGILLYQMKRLKESELAFLEALKHDRHNTEYIRNHVSFYYFSLRLRVVGRE